MAALASWRIGLLGPLIPPTPNPNTPIIFPSGTVGVPYYQDYYYLNDPTSWGDIQGCGAGAPPAVTPCSWNPTPNLFLNNWVSGVSNNVKLEVFGTPTTPGVFTFNACFYDISIQVVYWQVFQLTILPATTPSDPATLRYLDNTNNSPVPYGQNNFFNNEPADFWLGYDMVNHKICVTNYNRTTILCCFTPI